MIAAHSDWSVDPRKRWMTVGKRTGSAWHLGAPEYTGDVSDILRRLAARSDGEAVVFGIDCPIGLPSAYADQLSGFTSFPDFLRSLNEDDPFFQVASSIDQVSIERPFFPAGTISGSGHKNALARKLNLSDTGSMYRRVDLQTENRPAAGQLFWTLGAKQCGKAALAAWRALIIPALGMPNVKLWPFDGSFHDLIARGQITIAETYPAEAMRQIDIKLLGSKRDNAAREALADDFFRVMRELRITPSEALREVINSGFGSSKSGEDAFDSFIGALGMIKVINNKSLAEPPNANDRWEGWILGQVS